MTESLIKMTNMTRCEINVYWKYRS